MRNFIGFFLNSGNARNRVFISDSFVMHIFLADRTDQFCGYRIHCSAIKSWLEILVYHICELLLGHDVSIIARARIERAKVLGVRNVTCKPLNLLTLLSS